MRERIGDTRVRDSAEAAEWQASTYLLTYCCVSQRPRRPWNYLSCCCFIMEVLYYLLPPCRLRYYWVVVVLALYCIYLPTVYGQMPTRPWITWVVPVILCRQTSSRLSYYWVVVVLALFCKWSFSFYCCSCVKFQVLYLFVFYWPIPRLFFLYFSLINTVEGEQMLNLNFANDWIWTAELWCWKWLLCQLSHNPSP